MDLEQINVGLRAPINFRPGTADRDVIEGVLISRKEYFLPDCRPEVIFDVGSHIGSAALLFALAYPNTKIYCFEPDAENFKLLCMNTEMYKNIACYNVGLSSQTREALLFASDDERNTGGSSTIEVGVNKDKSQKIHLVAISEMMQSLGVDRIDFLKLDCEGAEYEILFRMFLDGKLPAHIVGEAHSVQDWKMFEMLSSSHELAVNKHFGVRCYPFYAARKEVHGRADKNSS